MSGPAVEHQGPTGPRVGLPPLGLKAGRGGSWALPARFGRVGTSAESRAWTFSRQAAQALGPYHDTWVETGSIQAEQESCLLRGW